MMLPRRGADQAQARRQVEHAAVPSESESEEACGLTFGLRQRRALWLLVSAYHARTQRQKQG